MRIDWKIRFTLAAVTAAGLALMIILFKIPADGYQTTSVAPPQELNDYQQSDVSLRVGFITEIVNIYEDITGKEISMGTAEENYTDGKESLLKAEALGLIESNDKVFYTENEGITLQSAADITYKMLTAADPAFAVTADEASHILNNEYNNSVIDEKSKTAYAFMVKHRIITNNFSENPLLPMTKEKAETVSGNIRQIFNSGIEFLTDGKKLTIGQSSASLVAKFGNPNRIDKTQYGFDWYIYNADYKNFMMVGVREGVICAFFSNSRNFECNGIKSGENMLRADEEIGDICTLLTDEQTGLLDAVYYISSNGVEKSEVTDEIRISESERLLDMINSARAKKKLPAYLYNTELSHKAKKNSIRLAEGNGEWGAEGEIAHLYGADLFACYEEMLSLRCENIWTYSPKQTAYGGIGIFYDKDKMYVTMSADDSSRLSVSPPKQTVPQNKVYPTVKAGIPIITAPTDNEKVADGEPILFMFGGAGAEKYHIEVLNCETRDYVVNTDITGDLTDWRVSADRFESGIDYEVNVKAYYGGEQVLEHTALIQYGEATPVEILAPTAEHILTKSEIPIIWRSDIYTDFRIDVYDAKNELTASSRIIDEKQTDISDLAAGKYTLKISAMRRDTNIVKATSETEFEIKKEQIQQYTPPSSPTVFKTNKYSAVFGGGLAVYTSKAEADANMVTIKIPVWHLNKDGSKTPSSASLTVNRAIADETLAIFTEIYNGSEKFPIKSAGCYNWRNTATGGKSHHSYGTAIDINPTENYCIYNTGKRIGSYWKPYDDPYSLPPDGDVVRTFKKYGWTWGGEWNSLKDYMHFSYLGG